MIGDPVQFIGHASSLKRRRKQGSQRLERAFGANSLMEKTSQCGCTGANEASIGPSLQEGRAGIAPRWTLLLKTSLSLLPLAIILAGCGSDAPKPEAQAAKPAAPAIPDEIQSAGASLLGSEAQVLVFGDLAKTGKQQFLVANVVPKTPTNNLPGTIITRAVIAENSGGKWSEILRCDEHLKNEKGYLGLTPLVPVSGWRIQYEQSDIKGLELYFTPLKGNLDPHVLPIGIRWNPATKRYQSLDRNYEHFLPESSSMQDARSVLR